MRIVSERTGNLAGDPFQGRQPTNEERRMGVPWDASYGDGPAPWDIGRPQPAIARVAAEGGFTGSVLDAGCGTGEHALLIASSGRPVLGVDVAGTAVDIARAKADERRIGAEFAVADAFQLARLGRTFDTVLDCGLFHTFDAGERPAYVASLASVTRPGATLHLLCFSDAGPGTGPHPVRRDELDSAFSDGTGWRIVAVEPERVHTRFHGDDGAPAWLATITRV
jgi:SAM-dependent methyltransferase